METRAEKLARVFLQEAGLRLIEELELREILKVRMEQVDLLKLIILRCVGIWGEEGPKLQARKWVQDYLSNIPQKSWW